MKIEKGELEAVFEAEVANMGDLPCGFGLWVDFKNLTNIGPQFHRPKSERRYVNPELFDVVTDAELVVLRNAKIEGIDNNAKLSGHKLAELNRHLTKSIHLPQDFWHKDVLSEHRDPKATVIHNPKGVTRTAPTLWAREAIVKNALLEHYERMLRENVPNARNLDAGTLARCLRRLGYTYMSEMAGPDYGFTLRGGDAQIRKVAFVGGAHRDLVTDLVKIMPQGSVYAHEWTGKPEITIHCNFGDILHARPRGMDTANALAGLTFSRD